MARNYFKSITGSAERGSLAEHIAFFDDTSPGDVRVALSEARAAFGLRGTVSVWRRAATVPTYIPAIGEMRPDADVLQPKPREDRDDVGAWPVAVGA